MYVDCTFVGVEGGKVVDEIRGSGNEETVVVVLMWILECSFD